MADRLSTPRPVRMMLHSEELDQFDAWLTEREAALLADIDTAAGDELTDAAENLQAARNLHEKIRVAKVACWYPPDGKATAAAPAPAPARETDPPDA